MLLRRSPMRLTWMDKFPGPAGKLLLEWRAKNNFRQELRTVELLTESCTYRERSKSMIQSGSQAASTSFVLCQ
jgi:hypothetical protein